MKPRRFQIAIDGTYARPWDETHEEHFRDLVIEAAKLAGMRVLDCVVRTVSGAIPKGSGWHDEGGVSVVALISTSHMALHVWPKDRYFMFDLVSCREFCVDTIRGFVCSRLNVDAIEVDWPFFQATSGEHANDESERQRTSEAAAICEGSGFEATGATPPD